MSDTNDNEERNAIWQATKVAASVLRRSWGVRIFLEYGANREIDDNSTVPSSINTWKLFEMLNILAVLTNAQVVISKEIFNLKGKIGPIEYVIKDGLQLFLWTQPKMIGQKSDLGAIPDIVVTNSRDAPTNKNIIQLIESKRVKSFTAAIIRQEFAKAFDLKVRTYLIWSYFTPNDKLVLAAEKLGLELISTGFDTEFRSKRLDPQNLLLFVSTTIKDSIETGKFTNLLSASADEARKKSTDLIISS